MKTLVIFSNPTPTGHCGAILRTVQAQLKERNEEYSLIDLNKENYDPVMHANEHYTAGKYDVTAQTQEYRDAVGAADRLIFIYPIWWNSMPAIMKGFCEKVFVGRFAFRYVSSIKVFGRDWVLPMSIPVGLLKGKRVVAFVTTGSAGWLTFLFLGNRFKSVASDLFGFCAMKAKVYHIDNCATPYSDEKLPRISKVVKKGLKRLYY